VHFLVIGFENAIENGVGDFVFDHITAFNGRHKKLILNVNEVL